MNRFPKSLLIIQAHPDDAEAWSAGTLALMAENGWKITIATITSGGMGGVGMDEDETVAIRANEAAAAAAEIGADYHSLGRPDGFLFDGKEVRLDTLALIRRVKAGIVITHAPFDYHQDHRTACTIADAAAMLATLDNVPCGEAPLPITPLLYHNMPIGLTDPLGNPVPEPHFFVDVSGRPIEKKIAMLSHHKSQIEVMRRMHKIDDFFGEMKKFNAELGTMIGVEHAECYWQHLGGGYQKDPLLQEELGDRIRRRTRRER